VSRRASLALLVCCGLTLPALAQDKADLKWTFDPKKPFYQTVNTKTFQTMKVTDQSVTQNQDQTFIFKWTPVKVEKDEVVIKQKIVGLKVNIDVGNSKIIFDSTAKENPVNPLTNFFNKIVGAEFTLTLDTKDGVKITKLEGDKDFVAALAAVNPNMKPLLEQILGNKALMEMALPTFNSVPGKTVEKGKPEATWKRESTIDMGPIGKYTTTYTYTYEGKDAGKGAEKIKVIPELKYTQPDDKAGGNLPFKIKSATLTASDASGEVYFTGGRVKESTLKMTLKGDLNVEIGQQTTKVDLTQNQTTTVTIDEKQPAGVKE